jgi:soluble cytochrome b562
MEIQLKRSNRVECEWTTQDSEAATMPPDAETALAELAMEIQLKRSNRVECEWTTQDSEAATMPPDAETALTAVTNKRHCTVPTVHSHKQKTFHGAHRAFVVYRGGVRIRCSEIHTSDLAQEIQLKRSSRAECEWNMKDWEAAMDEIEKRGCWGIKRRIHKCTGNPKRVHYVCLGGVRIGCSEIHKSRLAKEIQLKRSSRAECEWNMKDWQEAMDQIKTRGRWGNKRRNGKGTYAGNRVCLGGVTIWCSKIHKSELAMEIKLKRSSRAECEWTTKDWQAAMDEIKKRGCWGIKYHNHQGMGNPKRERSYSYSYSVRVGGLRIGCSKIHKSELEKEIKLKRSSRAECEWTMKDWQVAMDEIKKRGCWGVKLYKRQGMANPT